MAKKRIGFDIDGVLYPWHSLVYDSFKEYSGDICEEKFWKEWFQSDIRPIFVKNILADISLFGKFQMRAELQEMLERIKEKYDIFFVTQRPEGAFTITKRWLTDVNLYDDNLYLVEDKALMSRILNLDYFIEDRPENVNKLKLVVKTFIVSTPFNMDYYDENVIRLNYTVDLEDYL